MNQSQASGSVSTVSSSLRLVFFAGFAMRPDLLHAQAAVDWAVAQFPILEQRINGWLETCVCPSVIKFDAQRGKNAIKVRVDNPIPLIINAEVGAIINSIRSSLDLLATTLAQRNGHAAPMDVYFPISASAAEFADTGVKKIKRLSAVDITIIENLKPYKGGDDRLYFLHQMDIARKHRQLIDVGADIGAWNLSGVGLEAEFPASWARLENDAVLAWISPTATDYELNLTPEVTLIQVPTRTRRPVLSTLREFAGLAESIINFFA